MKVMRIALTVALLVACGGCRGEKKKTRDMFRDVEWGTKLEGVAGFRGSATDGFYAPAAVIYRRKSDVLAFGEAELTYLAYYCSNTHDKRFCAVNFKAKRNQSEALIAALSREYGQPVIDTELDMTTWRTDDGKYKVTLREVLDELYGEILYLPILRPE